ncbi:MAG: tRNA pseudouridine(38-40) synthase TruA [Candidatus Alcyoniella australis]|nr:tRNA pseudouridine(38-40) synthase TruA [Candidatus Alcyoniella australis]
MTQRYKATLEYDGRGFVGWQVQTNGKSIQHEVERALGVLNRGPVRVTASGRTDAGVHALAQVIHFDFKTPFEARKLRHGFNGLADQRISMIGLEPVDAAFDAQLSARSKLYRYTILNRYDHSPLLGAISWHVREQLDSEAMRNAARHLVGKHDFNAFKAADSCARTSERTVIEITLQNQGELLLIEVLGAGFLKHMVRNIVGSLVMVGTGKQQPDWVKQVLQGRDRTKAGPTAPPQGLALVRVDY